MVHRWAAWIAVLAALAVLAAMRLADTKERHGPGEATPSEVTETL